MAAKKSNFYLTREELVREIILSKQKHRESNFPRTPAECFTPNLISYLQLLVGRYANKSQWRNYTYIEDMKSEALLVLCQNAFKYNEEKYDNPFGYYTQIVKFSFLTSLEKEENNRDAKDSIWESIGMTPSYARQIKNEMLREIGDTSNKGLKALKKKTDLMAETINNVARLIAKLNRMKEPDMEVDFEISQTMEIENTPFTSDVISAISLFGEEIAYSIDNITIDDKPVICLRVQNASTKSNTMRVISDTSDDSVALALCSIGLTLRRDLMVKRFREISGYNLTPRYPVNEGHPAVVDQEAEPVSEYPPADPKRKRRRTP